MRRRTAKRLRHGLRQRNPASRPHRNEVQVGGGPTQQRIPYRTADGVRLQPELIGNGADGFSERRVVVFFVQVIDIDVLAAEPAQTAL